MHPARIGGYEVTGELGRGGMGAVYSGRDPRDGRPVAIKLLVAARGGDESRRRRFAREAEALSRLRHPGVVPVLAVGEEQGCPYLVLELVEGGSLEDRLARAGPLPPAEAVALVRALADTLAHAHSHGLLHRDVKPANVLLGPGGPRLVDFGLVKDLDPGRSRLSQTGMFLGTPGYMAPEQASGEHAQADARTDVYGLGATLYAALTGRPPIQATSMVDVLLATRDQAVEPPSRVSRGVSAALDAVCLRCLAKDPADRFASAAELARALVPGRPRRRRHGLGLAFAGGGGGALLVLAAVAAVWRPGAPPVTTVSSPDATTSSVPSVPPALASSVGSSSETQPDDTPSAASRQALEELDRGLEHERRGDHVAAATCFTRALELDPACGRAYERRGVARLNMQDHEGALADLDRAVELLPDDVASYFNRATARWNLDDFREALADCERSIELAPAGWASGHHLRAIILEALDDVRGAIDAYTLALSLDPTRGETLVNRGLLRSRQGDLAGAEDDFTAAIRLRPDWVKAVDARALLRSDRGDLQGAIDDYSTSLTLDPTRGATLYNRGLLRAERGDHVGAADDFTGALAVDPGLRAAYNDRGVARMNLGKLEEALADFDRALELEPGNLGAYVNRGTVRYKRGDHAGSITDCTKAIELDAGYAPPYLNRANSRLKARDTIGAIADFEQFLRLAPTHPHAVRAREQLARLRGE